MTSSLILSSAPGTEPITLAEAKAHCRVDASDDDTLLTAMIGAARHRAEAMTGRAFITQTWKLYLDAFPDGAIEVPLPQLVSVTSVKYIDTAGVQQTFTNTNYQVRSNSTPGQIELAEGVSWPSTRGQLEAIEVIFVAGYGAAAAVPQPIKQWLLMTVAGWYAKREQFITGTLLTNQPRNFYDALLDPYIIPKAV